MVSSSQLIATTISIVLEFAIATIGRGVLHGRLVYALGLQGCAKKKMMEKRRRTAKKIQYGHAIAPRYLSSACDEQPRNGNHEVLLPLDAILSTLGKSFVDGETPIYEEVLAIDQRHAWRTDQDYNIPYLLKHRRSSLSVLKLLPKLLSQNPTLLYHGPFNHIGK